MNDHNLFMDVEIFQGLTADELGLIASLCREKNLKQGEIVVAEEEPGGTLCIIKESLVSITKQTDPPGGAKEIIYPGRGQIIGEMSLVDGGRRSATVQALETPTRILEISQKDFLDLCAKNHHIGYLVYENIAADLSFKLR